jgi:hypothetical protein
MMDGEKRIVTFIGQSGRKTATIIWRDNIKMFEVLCEKPNDGCGKESKLFKDESEAQTFAEEFTWREKYGTI